MIASAHKTEGVNRKNHAVLPLCFTGNAPRKGKRIPLNIIRYNEQRDKETGYGYCNEYQPHAVRHIFDEENKTHCDLRWDPAGNLGQISVSLKDNVFDHGRFLFWTEDSRMHAAVDDKYYSYYVYDHRGERRLKLTGDSKLLDVNADIMATYTFLDNPTLYPSAYMVLTNKGYTKHYYAGTERVAARLGGGGLNALQPVIGNDVELRKKADILFKQSLDHVNHRVLGENDLKCIMNNEFARDEFGKRIDGIPYQVRSDVKVDNGQFKEMVYSMLYDRNQGHEKEVFFYHSDHLGSASWITDFEGIAVQHLQYLPYGEPYIDQRAAGTTYSERFRFTGKERDEETGFGYFGARYMDHELMTMWLSVDPMSDKYPSISPYAYCAWNPMRLVDPDGRDIWDLNSKTGELIWREASENDRIYARDGSYIDMNEGILTRGQSYTKESTGGRGFHFHLGDDAKKADQIFEFFADNAGVEFSLLGESGTPLGEESKYFHLTCSFDSKGDTYGSHYANAMSISGTLRDATHNHPDGNMQQSGLPESERIKAGLDWSPNDRGEDVGFSASMKRNLGQSAPHAVFKAYIYAPKGKNPGMPNGGYVCYGSTNPSIVNQKYYKGTAYSRYSRK